MKKRYVLGLTSALLTALTVVEAAAPACPAVERLWGADAGHICRAVTLSAGLGLRLNASPGAPRDASGGTGENQPATEGHAP